MNLPKLTKQQSEFLRHYALTQNGCEAYRRAYNCKNSNQHTIEKEATKLLNSPTLSPWLELMAINAKKVALDELNYSIKDCFDEVDEMKKIALNSLDKSGNPNVNAAIKAVELKGKLAGHFNNDKTDNTVSGNITVMGTVEIEGEKLMLNVGEKQEEE